MDLWNKVSIRVLGVGPKMYLGASANIILLWILWIFHWMVRTYKTSHVKAWQEEGPYLLVQGFFGPNLKFNKGIRIFAQSRAPFLFPFYLTRKKKYEYWCFRWREYEHVNLIVFKSLRYFFFFLWGGSLSDTCHNNWFKLLSCIAKFDLYLFSKLHTYNIYSVALKLYMNLD